MQVGGGGCVTLVGGFDCEINGKLIVFNFRIILHAVVRVLKVLISAVYESLRKSFFSFILVRITLSDELSIRHLKCISL